MLPDVLPAPPALRLEAWLDGPSAESWLKGQIAYDLWQARQTGGYVEASAVVHRLQGMLDKARADKSPA